jgi:hypothetical protein
MISSIRAPLLALLAGIALSACGKPKPGDACKGGGVCLDAQGGALVCVSGKWVETSCKGPDRCIKEPFKCDVRGNAAGDACLEEEGRPMVCSTDKKARIRCTANKIERDECDGKQGCFSKTAATMGCDKRLKAGDACSLNGDWCSSDQKDWLTCKDGKLVVAGHCRGPAACAPFADTVACDVSVAEAEDPCSGTTTACASDKKSVLACRGGTMKVDQPCPADKPCSASGREAACAK